MELKIHYEKGWYCWCVQKVDGTLEARMGQRLTFIQAVQAATQAWKRFLQEVA